MKKPCQTCKSKPARPREKECAGCSRRRQRQALKNNAAKHKGEKARQRMEELYDAPAALVARVLIDLLSEKKQVRDNSFKQSLHNRIRENFAKYWSTRRMTGPDLIKLLKQAAANRTPEQAAASRAAWARAEKAAAAAEAILRDANAFKAATHNWLAQTEMLNAQAEAFMVQIEKEIGDDN